MTVAGDGGHFPGPAEFAVEAEQAPLNGNASVVSAHTAGQIISVATIETVDLPMAVPVASKARPVVSSSALRSDESGLLDNSPRRAVGLPSLPSGCRHTG